MSHFNVEDIDNKEIAPVSTSVTEDMKDEITIEVHEVFCGYMQVVSFEQFFSNSSNKIQHPIVFTPNQTPLKEAQGVPNPALYPTVVLNVPNENRSREVEVVSDLSAYPEVPFNISNENQVKDAEIIPVHSFSLMGNDVREILPECSPYRMRDSEAVSLRASLDVMSSKIGLKEEVTVEERPLFVDVDQCEEEGDGDCVTSVVEECVHYEDDIPAEDVVNRSLTCSVCGISFTARNELSKHLLTHNEKETLSGLSKCFSVPKENEKSGTYKEVDESRTSEIREKPFETQNDLDQHFLVNSENKMSVTVMKQISKSSHVFKTCRRPFKSSSGLSRHVLTHTDNKITKYEKKENERSCSAIEGSRRNVGSRRNSPRKHKKLFETSSDHSKHSGVRSESKIARMEKEEKNSSRPMHNIYRKFYKTRRNRNKRSLIQTENDLPDGRKEEKEKRSLHRICKESVKISSGVTKHSSTRIENEMPQAKKKQMRSNYTGIQNVGKKVLEDRSVYNTLRTSRKRLSDIDKHSSIQRPTGSGKLNNGLEAGKRSRLCRICKKSFETSSGLIKHFLSHGETETLDTEIGEDKKYCIGNEVPRMEIKTETDKSSPKRKMCTEPIETMDSVGGLSSRLAGKEASKAEMKSNKSNCVRKICNKSFKTQSSLRGHCTKSHSYACDRPTCNKCYTKPEHLTLHLESHRAQLPYKCKECEEGFGDLGSLNRHSIEHIKKWPYECEFCTKTFTRLPLLRDHLKVHTDKYPHVCSYCQKQFKRLYDLNYHVLIHTGKRTPGRRCNYDCDYCGKKFSSIGSLQKHIRTHTGERPYKCDTCDKSFKEMGHLKTHTFVHTGKRLFVCKVCNKSFKQPTSLSRHVLLHNEHLPHKCVCGKEFTQLYKLKKHALSHRSTGPFICETCGKSFVEINFLRIHILNHSGTERHACKVCGRRFITLDRLNSHMPHHSADKQYKCRLCPKSFVKHSALLIHKKTHTDERLYKCGYCNRCFKKAEHLKTHVFIHTPDRLFECDECKKTFKQPTALHRHLRIHLRSKDWVPKNGFLGFK